MAAKDTRPALDLGELRLELAAQGMPWRSADTSMAMLTEEQRAKRLGVPVPSPAEIRALEQASQAIRAAGGTTIGAAIGAPASYDARNVGGQNYVTPIKDQGDCGSCVSFGACATHETTAALTRGAPGLALDLSEAHLHYTHAPATGGSCDGWWPEHAFAACRDIGVTTDDYFPYSPHNRAGHSLNADWPNKLARGVDVRAMTGDVAAMKEHIATYGAVSACFLVYQDFFSYASGVYRHVSGTDPGGHCVALIGYDDGQSCWIAKNSWGTGWGDGGFFRIGYGECGIETWRVHGVRGVSLRMWHQNRHVLGLWTSDHARNAWAFVENVGWLQLAPDHDVTSLSMLAELTAAKGANRPINVFSDGTIAAETYVL